MEAVEVYLGPKGHVVIRQHCGFLPSNQIILDPSQVPAVVEWMKAVADEADRLKQSEISEDTSEPSVRLVQE